MKMWKQPTFSISKGLGQHGIFSSFSASQTRGLFARKETGHAASGDKWLLVEQQAFPTLLPITEGPRQVEERWPECLSEGAAFFAESV